MSNGVRVLVDEEYGYRYWIWDTGLSENELAEWFLSQNGEESEAFEPHHLFGSIREVSEDDREWVSPHRSVWRAMFHTIGDSWLRSSGGMVYTLSEEN